MYYVRQSCVGIAHLLPIRARVDTRAAESIQSRPGWFRCAEPSSRALPLDTLRAMKRSSITVAWLSRRSPPDYDVMRATRGHEVRGRPRPKGLANVYGSTRRLSSFRRSSTLDTRALDVQSAPFRRKPRPGANAHIKDWCRNRRGHPEGAADIRARSHSWRSGVGMPPTKWTNAASISASCGLAAPELQAMVSVRASADLSGWRLKRSTLRPGGHPGDRARLDALRTAEAVAVNDRPRNRWRLSQGRCADAGARQIVPGALRRRSGRKGGVVFGPCRATSPTTCRRRAPGARCARRWPASSRTTRSWWPRCRSSARPRPRPRARCWRIWARRAARCSCCTRPTSTCGSRSATSPASRSRPPPSCAPTTWSRAASSSPNRPRSTRWRSVGVQKR